MTAFHYNYNIKNLSGNLKVSGIFTLRIPNSIIEKEFLDACHIHLKNMDIVELTGPYNCKRKFIYDEYNDTLIDVLELIKV